MDRMGMFQMPPLVAPQLTNQPPQIFGSYLADGLPQLTPDMAAHMFPDSSMLLDDTLDAKRRRIARVGLLYVRRSDVRYLCYAGFHPFPRYSLRC
jgi:hypothetical protein